MQLEFSVHCVQGKTINDLNEYIDMLDKDIELGAIISIKHVSNNEYNIIIRKHHFAFAGIFTAKVNTLIQVIESNLNNVVEFI